MLREIVEGFEETVIVEEPVSKELEITRYLLKYKDRPVLFKDVDGWTVAGNIWSTRERIASYLGTKKENLLHLIAGGAMENPRPCRTVERAPFMANSTADFSLRELPVPRYYPRTGGPVLHLRHGRGEGRRWIREHLLPQDDGDR